MYSFFAELKTRNSTLFYFGWLCLISALVCIVLSFTSDTIVLGINAWIKPMKFFLSTVIFSWSMGWYLFYLNDQRKTAIYNWVLIITFLFELIYITWQAAKGELSHFNVSSAFHGMMFSLMGIAITIITAWTGYIAVLFWRKSFPRLSESYLWGIRFGLLLFVVFAFAGGLMAARLSHTVGSVMETTQGLPVLNWSRESGDLRIAHFVGMHALQVLPLLGYFVLRKKRSVIFISILYSVIVSALLWQALKGVPLIPLGD
jgi:hypothetical protein